MKYIFLGLICFVFFGCKEENKAKDLSADDIINESIKVSGGEKFKNSVIRFNFRDKFYVARRSNGNATYIRIFAEGKDSIFDLMSSNNFERSVNSSSVRLSDSLKILYSASVKSVHYFSVLPFGLNDKAVNKELLEEESINNENYYKIKVTFDEEGGGEDFEDVFVYWVNKKNFKVDYLAYSYNEDDDIGIRFRSSYNERYLEGIRIVDYNNYKSEEKIDLFDLGKAFEDEQLKLLSKIELENVEVELIE